MESQQQRVQRVLLEPVDISPYDPAWAVMFRQEKEHLLSCLPADLIRRVEHFGSTAVPGLAAKPIVDILVEVTDLQATRVRIAPVLESQGYEYFWRPTRGDDGTPFYAWFIKREYEAVKIRLASAFPADRIAYTRGKSEFIDRVTDQAKRYYVDGRDASTQSEEPKR
jgi:GrpB-like predicted nucleotidyltransferase (UPF0157 family)